MDAGGVGVTGVSEDLVSVRIIGLPVALFAAARERPEGLLRELALVQVEDDEAHEEAAGFLAIASDLRDRYGSLIGPVRERLEAAVEAGEDTIDLEYEVPVSLADPAAEYARRLEAADDYCRRGDLLTLEPSEEVVAFRRWLLGEFTRQLRGAEPLPWGRWRASS